MAKKGDKSEFLTIVPIDRKKRAETKARDDAPKHAAVMLSALPPMPEDIRASLVARETWNKVGEQLTKLRRLSLEDIQAFEAYCFWQADFMEATQECARNGLVIQTAYGPAQNPFFSIK